MDRIKESRFVFRLGIKPVEYKDRYVARHSYDEPGWILSDFYDDCPQRFNSSRNFYCVLRPTGKYIIGINEEGRDYIKVQSVVKFRKRHKRKVGTKEVKKWKRWGIVPWFTVEEVNEYRNVLCTFTRLVWVYDSCLVYQERYVPTEEEFTCTT